jgi:hypothetical protein
MPFMGEKSRLWLASAGLLVGAAVLAGSALALYWEPCAGNMLTGSAVNGYRFEPEFTQSCLVAMDEAPNFPLPTIGWTLVGTLGALSAVLMAAAWLVLLPTVRMSRGARLVVASPALVVLGVALGSQLAALGPAGEGLPNWAFLLVEFSVVPAVLLLANSGVAGGLLVRYVVVLLGATAIGEFHVSADFIVALALSEATWDSPPGTGLANVAGMLLLSVTTVVLWRVQGSPSRRPIAAAAAPAITTTM